MRTEKEMFDLILDTARTDERIRAVILNGSRANPNARRDIFQDYDIVYVVRSVASFRRDPAWIDRFGELMVMQTPEAMGDTPAGADEPFVYLMQFMDGNRIDLTLYPLEKLAGLAEDSLSVLLLDKDGLIPPFAPPDESDYLPRPPSAGQYSDCCNEFWWMCPYAAKGLWRGELPYARAMLEKYLRPKLVQMLAWYVGVKSAYKQNPGKEGKYLEFVLPPKMWRAFLKTCPGPTYEETWDALLEMGPLFRLAALEVGACAGFVYPHEDDRRVSAHLRHVRSLPGDAQEIYPANISRDKC